ncbi:hypothetical protein [Wielerella bovis]|uniref:hypothetical protein n=1 Tax=Wielerella bovis TaxID=2917790 RepID=UPI002019B895|nr:hypothetical protein [Wielerella bovis]ULJ63776.1 hypothetical protein MIS33_06250 [Wielerella bovis]ULJ66056.1 hypothetical protein MIS31_07185 [Wielerella bovis]
MTLKLLSRVCAMAMLACAGNAYAEVACSHSYGIQTSVNGVAGQTYCSSNANDFIDYVKNLKNTHEDYTTTSAANVVGRFNDVDITLSYDANSNKLTFNAPEIGVEGKTFEGATRSKSQDEFEDWLKKSGVIGEILRYQAKNSATSAITGAGGLIPTLSETDYNTGMSDTSNISNATNTITTNSGNVLGIGASFGSYSIDGSADKVETMTLPLSYTNKLDRNPNHQMIFTLPVSMYKVGKSKGYHVGLGMAYRYPVTERWTLTPGVRYSITGSADRATVASVMSGTLMSTYTLPVVNDKLDLTIGNMVGYYKTGKFKAGDYSFDPNIKQTMLRNGLMLSQPIMVKGKKLAIEYSAIDTRYIGSEKPFMKNMQEYGVTLGFHRDAVAENSKLSALRAGITYTNAKGANGVGFNFGYWF